MTGEMTTDPVPSVVEAIQAVMRDATDEQLRTIPQSASCNVAAVRADPVWWCPEHGTIYFQHSWDFSLRRHRRTTSCAAEMVNLVAERTELTMRVAALTNTDIELIIERNKLLDRIAELEDWVRDALHHAGCSGGVRVRTQEAAGGWTTYRCKCGLDALLATQPAEYSAAP